MTYFLLINHHNWHWTPNQKARGRGNSSSVVKSILMQVHIPSLSFGTNLGKLQCNVIRLLAVQRLFWFAWNLLHQVAIVNKSTVQSYFLVLFKVVPRGLRELVLDQLIPSTPVNLYPIISSPGELVPRPIVPQRTRTAANWGLRRFGAAARARGRLTVSTFNRRDVWPRITLND